MNLPNSITLGRLVVTAATFACLELASLPMQSSGSPVILLSSDSPDAVMAWTAFILFLVAAVTDFLDGFLARRMGLVTAFGRVFDPFADKVLIAGVLVMLLKFPAATAVMPAWFVVVVIAREFLVTAVRGLVEASGRAFPADRLGKWKMVAQCWTAAALMTLVAGTDIWHWAAVSGVWVSLVLTVVSGINYVWKARDVLFRS